MMAIDCGRCGTCCTDPIVLVNDAEVKKLIKATALPATKIVRFYSFDELNWPKDACDWVELRQGRRIMGLRRIREKCMFLGKKGCTVYHHRPWVCRLFPFDVHLDDEDADGETSAEVQSRVDGCKAVLTNRPLEHPELVRNANALARTDDLYQARIARWNGDNPRGTIKEFLTFLRLLP